MTQADLLGSAPHWTVSELTRYLRGLLESDEVLHDVWVNGEISNLARPQSGHIYFTLKDTGASLRCVMWRSMVQRVKFNLQDGTSVEIHGGIGVYEPQGQYQLYVDSIQPLGEGALFREFLRRKALLEAEGLFSAERKRPIPEQVRRLGVVTSPSGAALMDILNTLRRRNPLLEVFLAPSAVQGEEAPSELVSALTQLNRIANLDVILLARGGGSIEDLWSFNDERVVRAVAASKVPVITGVGHETDFTLVDFVADLRAPTPTAAAELASQLTILDMRSTLREMRITLEERLCRITNDLKAAWEETIASLGRVSPARRILVERQRLDDLVHRGGIAQNHHLSLARTQVASMTQRLEALNPFKVLQRGYAIVTRKIDGGLVSRVDEAEMDDDLAVRLGDGSLGVRVTEKEQE